VPPPAPCSGGERGGKGSSFRDGEGNPFQRGALQCWKEKDGVRVFTLISVLLYGRGGGERKGGKRRSPSPLPAFKGGTRRETTFSQVSFFLTWTKGEEGGGGSPPFLSYGGNELMENRGSV